MTAKSCKRQPPRHYYPSLLLILTAIFFNPGSAFIPWPSTHAASAMSNNMNNPNPKNTAGAHSESKPLSAAEGSNSGENSHPSLESAEEILQLPEASRDPSIPSIKLGESIRFEEMGPVIINADGTTRRINNWNEMTKQEQDVAWRRISKRNEQRRKALLEQQQRMAIEGKKEQK